MEHKAERYTLYNGDCLDVMATMPDASVDAIITDPPYPKKYEYLYGEMGKHAKRILRPGGSLLTLCGHYQLQRISHDISEHLRYRWIIKYDQPGSYARMAMGVLVTWKPILWFTNGPLSPKRNIIDQCISPKAEKSSGHPWQQSLTFSDWCIESVTDANDMVLDPFMGSGSTGVSCFNLNRKFIGVELDADYFEIAKQRIHEATLPELQPALIESSGRA